MKTAVSVPDALFKKADVLAKRLETSRSRLYSLALREYVERHSPEAVLAALKAVYARQPSALDPSLAAAQSRVLAREAW